jgi:hypothetical protein
MGTPKLDGTFFFDKDDSGHWYMIPSIMRAEWDEASELEGQDELYEEAMEPFDQYRLPGGITDITFKPVDFPY